jgi:hypothetical protein
MPLCQRLHLRGGIHPACLFVPQFLFQEGNMVSMVNVETKFGDIPDHEGIAPPIGNGRKREAG